MKGRTGGFVQTQKHRSSFTDRAGTLMAAASTRKTWMTTVQVAARDDCHQDSILHDLMRPWVLWPQKSLPQTYKLPNGSLSWFRALRWMGKVDGTGAGCVALFSFNSKHVLC